MDTRIRISRALRTLGVLITLVFGAFHAAQAQTKPNVILIVADDMGVGDIAAWGHPYILTPNLDGIIASANAAELRSFWTAQASCSGSRAGLHTGNSCLAEGIIDVCHASTIPPSVPATEQQLGTLFSANGYKCYQTGKFGIVNTSLQSPVKLTNYGYSFTAGNGNSGEDIQGVIRDDRKSFVEARNEMDTHKAGGANAGKPFFVHVGLTMPHDVVSDGIADAINSPAAGFASKDYRTPYTAMTTSTYNLTNDGGEGNGTPDLSMIPTYFGAIAMVDEVVGLFKSYLDANFPNTILIFLSDNGPDDNNGAGWASFGSIRVNYIALDAGATYKSFSGSKSRTHAGGSLTPCLWYAPTFISSHQIVNGPTGGIDILPTLVDMCGLYGATQVDGENIRNAVTGAAAFTRKKGILTFAATPSFRKTKWEGNAAGWQSTPPTATNGFFPEGYTSIFGGGNASQIRARPYAGWISPDGQYFVTCRMSCKPAAVTILDWIRQTGWDDEGFCVYDIQTNPRCTIDLKSAFPYGGTISNAVWHPMREKIASQFKDAQRRCPYYTGWNTTLAAQTATINWICP